MTIIPDSQGRAEDFINQSEKDVAPANDAGRVAKLESDAKIHQDFIRSSNIQRGVVHEALAISEAVSMGGYNDSAVTDLIINEFQTTNNVATIKGTSWAGQTFISPDSGMRISNLDVRLLRNGTVTAGSVRAQIYATSGGLPTGSALITSSNTIDRSTISSGGSGSTHNFTFATELELDGNTQYAIVLSESVAIAGSGHIQWRGDANYYSDGTTVTSGDSGSSWSTTVNDCSFQINGWVGKTGELFLTDANFKSSLNSFIGFAREAVSATDTGDVNIGNYADGFSGLTTGKFYYISETPGTLTTTKPTNVLAVGFALSPTELKVRVGDYLT